MGLDAVDDKLARRCDEEDEQQADETVRELRAALEQLEGAFGEST